MTQGTFRDGPRVVVGIDGSPGAWAAAEFAVREARLRGARLVAVTALGLADAAHFDPYSVHMQAETEIVARAEQTVGAATGALTAGPPAAGRARGDAAQPVRA
jgi:nucleotide-binding universal stress UspA family protein